HIHTRISLIHLYPVSFLSLKSIPEPPKESMHRGRRSSTEYVAIGRQLVLGTFSKSATNESKPCAAKYPHFPLNKQNF
ncbi:MAG: hypothetical protein RR625_05405, partial [Christensenellaceae bacterium]